MCNLRTTHSSYKQVTQTTKSTHNQINKIILTLRVRSQYNNNKQKYHNHDSILVTQRKCISYPDRIKYQKKYSGVVDLYALKLRSTSKKLLENIHSRILDVQDIPMTTKWVWTRPYLTFKLCQNSQPDLVILYRKYDHITPAHKLILHELHWLFVKIWFVVFKIPKDSFVLNSFLILLYFKARINLEIVEYMIECCTYFWTQWCT